MKKAKETNKMNKAKTSATKKTVEEKLPAMTVINGLSSKPVNRTLNDVYNIKYSKFEVATEEDYKNKIEKLTKLDLQHECIKMGLMPHDNRVTMVERLMKICRQHFVALETARMIPQKITLSAAGQAALARMNRLS